MKTNKIIAMLSIMAIVLVFGSAQVAQGQIIIQKDGKLTQLRAAGCDETNHGRCFHEWASKSDDGGVILKRRNCTGLYVGMGAGIGITVDDNASQKMPITGFIGYRFENFRMEAEFGWVNTKLTEPSSGISSDFGSVTTRAKVCYDFMKHFVPTHGGVVPYIGIYGEYRHWETTPKFTYTDEQTDIWLTQPIQSNGFGFGGLVGCKVYLGKQLSVGVEASYGVNTVFMTKNLDSKFASVNARIAWDF